MASTAVVPVTAEQAALLAELLQQAQHAQAHAQVVLGAMVAGRVPASAVLQHVNTDTCTLTFALEEVSGAD